MQTPVELGWQDGEGYIGEVSQKLGLGACSSRLGGYVEGAGDLPAFDGRSLIDAGNGGDVEACHILGGHEGKDDCQKQQDTVDGG